MPNNGELKALPNIFNDFFASKVTTIRSNFSTDLSHSFDDYPFVGNSLVHFSPLSTDDIKNIVLLSPFKSCSLDPMPTSLLVKNIDFLIDLILCINKSLCSGIMPACLKHAIISPLLKKSNLDQNELKN